MCKDKLGDCGCGCKKCGGKSESVAKKSSSLPVVKPMVSSGYSKYSDTTYKPTVSNEFTKKDDPSNDVISPDVEVMPSEVTTKKNGGNGGVIAAGISLLGLFLVAAFADRDEKKDS